MSRGNAALTSTSAADRKVKGRFDSGAAAKEERLDGSGSVTRAFAWSTIVLVEAGGKYRDENGGGSGEGGLEDEEAAGPG